MTGVAFDEVMAGQVTMGEKDPWTGYLGEGTVGMVLRATVEIDDIAAFVDDPDHAARLRTTVDAPRLGERFSSHAGLFGLFVPTDEARTTQMVYEWPVLIDGREHWVRGAKDVTVAAPWRMWPATTTLLTTVHDGSDSSGPVVAAGILRLGVPELLSMIGTMRGVGVGPLRRSWAVLRFLSFFCGGLVSTYVLRRRA